jgi:iduronate 2-sulfatase
LYRLEEIQVPTVPADELADIPLYGKAMALGTLPGGDHQNVLDLGPDYWREMVRAYLACVSFVDDQVGKVLDALHGSPYAANTVVVLWSDHGQHLGEKRHWRKQCLWEESTRVPLAFVIPGSTSNGHPSKRPVSLLDIYPTLIELCELPPLDVLEGQSLVPLLKNPTVAWDRPAVTTWHYRNHSVRGERWHYIVYRDGSEELYDHDSDPQEFRNLAGQNEYHEIVTALRRWLPKTNTLPSGTSRWEGDKLDRILTRWQQGGGPPAWLQ